MSDKLLEDKGKSKGFTRLDSTKLLYAIDESPPWHLCILLGFQHFLTMFGATISSPLFLSKSLCIESNDVVKGEIICTLLLVSGLVTSLQVTFGCRLPMVQSASFVYVLPLMSLLSLEKWKCNKYYESSLNSTMNWTENTEKDWRVNMREVQGAIIVSGILEVIIGFTGVIGVLLKFITPLTIVPAITLLGLSGFKSATIFASKHWGIACFTMILVLLFSQYLPHIQVPCVQYNHQKGFHKFRIPLFKMFPVFLAMMLSWLICLILTLTNILPQNEINGSGYWIRTDIRTQVLDKASWIYIPYPGQWGIPTISLAGVFGIMPSVLASIVDSIGEYLACARMCNVPTPPNHAINRGIAVEGIGCILAGAWGTGTGFSTLSGNIGVIGITKTASRRVIQYSSIIMILIALSGKFGALFTTIPDPVIGGNFCIVFGMITAVGLSGLQQIDMSSSRNLFILGFSIFLGFLIPEWINKNPDSIATGYEELDEILKIFLMSHMLLGGLIGIILDNSIPGTEEERGIGDPVFTCPSALTKQEVAVQKCYDLPILNNFIRRVRIFKYFPICQTFNLHSTLRGNDMFSKTCKPNASIGNESTDKYFSYDSFQRGTSV